MGVGSVLIALVMLVTGCASWSRSALVPEQNIGERNPKRVRVQLKDGRRLVIDHPYVVGDSLVGHSPNSAVALVDIESLDTRKTSAPKTVAFILLMGTLAIGVAIAIAFGIGGATLD